MELAADDSLAAMRARSRFGMAIAAIMRMIATTISNSISEKPLCFFISSPGMYSACHRFPVPTLSRILTLPFWIRQATFRAQQGAARIVTLFATGRRAKNQVSLNPLSGGLRQERANGRNLRVKAIWLICKPGRHPEAIVF